MKEKLAENKKNQERTVVPGPQLLLSCWIFVSHIQKEVQYDFFFFSFFYSAVRWETVQARFLVLGSQIWYESVKSRRSCRWCWALLLRNTEFTGSKLTCRVVHLGASQGEREQESKGTTTGIKKKEKKQEINSKFVSQVKTKRSQKQREREGDGNWREKPSEGGYLLWEAD